MAISSQAVSAKNHSGSVFLVNTNNANRVLFFLGLLSILAGCATSPPPQRQTNLPTVEERVVVDGEVLPLPEERDISAQPLPEVQAVSPVVQRLLSSANTQAKNGNTDAAANSLERALRIEPRNALLWSKLASVRFSQQDWQQAIQLAAKSNTLSGNNQGLRRQNWNLMGNAYEALGDAAAAERYRSKLRSL